MEDYKQRVVSEYKELVKRTKKIGEILQLSQHQRMMFGCDFDCPLWLLQAQWHTMNAYIAILEQRAEIENIDLEA